MTSKESTTRLVLYILIAMGTAASAGIPTVNFSDAKHVIGFVLSVAMTGLVTARSYIDQSPNQVGKP